MLEGVEEGAGHAAEARGASGDESGVGLEAGGLALLASKREQDGVVAGVAARLFEEGFVGGLEQGEGGLGTGAGGLGEFDELDGSGLGAEEFEGDGVVEAAGPGGCVVAIDVFGLGVGAAGEEELDDGGVLLFA